MSHEILNRDVQVGIEMAWHRLTKIVPMINKQNCRIAYPMALEPLSLMDGQESGFYGVVSLDDRKMCGSPVGQGYRIVTNEQMIDMVTEALAGTQHKIVSVGSVGNRERCFCSVKLSDAIQAGGRQTDSVLNILWGHGGAFGVTAKTGLTVVVCANTYAMAIAERGEFTLKMKHTANVQSKLDNMSLAIDAHLGVVAEFKTAMDDFAGRPVNTEQATQFVAGFLVREKNPTEVSTRTQNQIGRMVELFNHGKGNRGETACDLFNAVTDYYTHESSGGEDRWRQFESSEFGAGQIRKGEAFAVLREPKSTVPKLGTLADVVSRGKQVMALCN